MGVAAGGVEVRAKPEGPVRISEERCPGAFKQESASQRSSASTSRQSFKSDGP